VSGRGTNTVYLISGRNGTILWRLGGTVDSQSDFTLRGFNFSAQHDARMLQSNGYSTLISLLDNASDGYEATSDTSAGMVISLNHTDRTATLVNRFSRPDGGISDRRGNVQSLSKGTFMVCWSRYGWITEFDEEGRDIADIRFKDEKLYTYRAYKVEASGFANLTPSELPVLRAFGQVDHQLNEKDKSVQLSAYVSWNGGFQAFQWRLFGCPLTKKGEPSQCAEEWTLLATSTKRGFETKIEFNSRQAVQLLYAEALDGDGKSVGRSPNVVIEQLDEGPNPQDDSPDEAETSPNASDILLEDTDSMARLIDPTPSDGRLHGLYVLPSDSTPSWFSWITWTILLWCGTIAAMSIFLSLQYLCNGRTGPWI
jgi:hypothetical protein